MAVNFDFSSRRILVTGGTRGIGRGLSIALAQSNAQVIAIHSCAPEKVQPFDKNLAIETVQCDLSSSSEFIKKTLDPLMPVHALVNNAGIGKLEPFLETTSESFQETLKVNTESAMVCGQIVAKSMIQNEIKGCIVNISSQAGLLPLNDHTSYCCSKAAMDSLTRSMALELGCHGIRVNSLNPTVVLTDMGRTAWGDPAKAGPMLDRIPLRKFAEIEDVVRAAMFLLSDGAAMITGITLPVDGGFSNS